MSQHDLIIDSGLSPGYISQLEDTTLPSPVDQPSASTLFSLAKALQVEAVILLATQGIVYNLQSVNGLWISSVDSKLLELLHRWSPKKQRALKTFLKESGHPTSSGIAKTTP